MRIARRPATDADRELVRRFHHLSYREVVEQQFGPWVEARQDEFFERAWEAAPHEVILCDGLPVGYISVEDRADDVHVRDIVIAPEFQGRGIGTAVLSAMIEHARARRVPVHLGTFVKNRAANLYRRMGFRESGRTAMAILFEWSEQ